MRKDKFVLNKGLMALCVILIILTALIIVTVILSNRKNSIPLEKIESGIDIDVINGRGQCFGVEKGDIILSDSFVSAVENDNYLEEYSITGDVNVTLGQIVKKGDYLGQSSGVKSGINGRIVNIYSEDNINKVSIINSDNFYVNLSIPANNSQGIDYKSKVIIQYDNKNLEGKVEYINYIIVDGHITVKVKISDPDCVLLKGCSANVLIVKKEIQSVTRISKNAIDYSSQNDITKVLVVKEPSVDGKKATLEYKYINITFVGDHYYQISGLNAGEIIFLPY